MSLAEQKKCQIHQGFYQFMNEEVLPLTPINKQKFWRDFECLIADLQPLNRALLNVRQQLQSSIDQWHEEHPGEFDPLAYKSFLCEIGYLHDEGEDFSLTTDHVDSEISSIAGPQLVVPASNARFVLNAANSRWGSLYDALYATDVIEHKNGLKPGKKYNEARGQAVVHFSKNILDQIFPLDQGLHQNVKSYVIYYNQLLAFFPDGSQSGLQRPCQFVALAGHKEEPTSIILKNNGLHVELVIDRNSSVGSKDLSGVSDILVESALTTIVDFEDSVATVDGDDKIGVYRNWLGLMCGNLDSRFEKDGKLHLRKLEKDKCFRARNGDDYRLHGRALLLARNVGHLMETELLQDAQGNNAPEGIVDAVVTALIGSLDLQRDHEFSNSRSGSIYIVKPKMHGPEEVAFCCELFDRVEDMLYLDRNTLKLGIMDEERRTTVNLKACIREAKDRLVFINTGFLDRTGDEIHTSMQAGAFLTKGQLKKQPWLAAYEDWNVDVGLACGLAGKAQIGKGMWAMPDEMSAMMTEKISHPLAAATTAWVPSPTAATLHALHYHYVDVLTIQKKNSLRQRASLEAILTPALMDAENTLSTEDVERELENNIQGILGYVVRWVDDGIGCSKVPDIDNIALMEDRATLRISSQHIANWLCHKVCTEEQVLNVMRRMAAIVDEQNSSTVGYQRMSDDIKTNLAFNAARDLIFSGKNQPNGYTEPLLHHYRLQAKSQAETRSL